MLIELGVRSRQSVKVVSLKSTSQVHITSAATNTNSDVGILKLSPDMCLSIFET